MGHGQMYAFLPCVLADLNQCGRMDFPRESCSCRRWRTSHCYRRIGQIQTRSARHGPGASTPRLPLSLFSTTWKRTGLTVWICCKPDGRRMCAACSSAAVNIAFEVGQELQKWFLLLAYPLLRLVICLESFAITTIRTIRLLVDANAALMSVRLQILSYVLVPPCLL